MIKFSKKTEKKLSKTPEQPTVIQMICDDPWFTHIRNGVKPVEGRKNTPTHQKIQVGCLINFSNGKDSFLATVIEIRSYPSLEAYLTDVTFQLALPGITSFEEAIKVYHQWSTPEEIQKYGFLGIFVKPITQPSAI